MGGDLARAGSGVELGAKGWVGRPMGALCSGALVCALPAPPTPLPLCFPASLPPPPPPPPHL